MKKYRVTVDGQIFDVVVEEIPHSESLENRVALHPEALSEPAPVETETAPVKIPPPADGTMNVEAPMPGSIIDIAVRSGDRVKEGDLLLTLEAMKMENEITAPRPGTVRRIYVNAGDTVGSGEPLMELS